MKRMQQGIRTVLALALSLSLAATGAWAFGEDKFEREVEKEKEAVKVAKEMAKGGYQLVTTEELKAWIDSGKVMLVVDTMPFADSYQKEHIPGAQQFLFPIPEMASWDAKETDGKSEADFAALLGPDKERPIVFYCGFVKCGRSHNGALWAKKLGYTNVYRQPGGIFAWKGAGYPTQAAE
ncbi:MAG: rhodanese-like domain-containing protein [Thermodesulfobacteriota bacterium]